MIHAGQLEFRHIPVHAGDDFIVIFFGDFGVIHIPSGKFFCQDLLEDIVFIIGDGFVDAAF